MTSLRRAEAFLQLAEIKREKHDITSLVYFERAKKEYELAKTSNFDFEIKLNRFVPPKVSSFMNFVNMQLGEAASLN